MLPPKVSKTAALCNVMKFDRNNKCDFCYYGQVNSPRRKSGVATPYGVTFILLALVRRFS